MSLRLWKIYSRKRADHLIEMELLAETEKVLKQVMTTHTANVAKLQNFPDLCITENASISK